MVTRVTLSEAADQLGVHYMTAYRYVRSGRLPAELRKARWTVSVFDLRSFATTSFTATRGRTTITRRHGLHNRMVKGDEVGAWGVIEEALSSGSAPPYINSELLIPCLRIIGDEWEAGSRSIAEEHRASEISGHLIGRLGPCMARRGPKCGTVVLGMVPEEQHGLGAAVLSDLLRRAGFEPINTGPNTPSASCVEMAKGADRLLAVMVGATMTRSDAALREEVTALKRAALPVPTFVGGRAVRDEEHAKSLGADGWYGHHAEDALARLRSLVAAR